MSSEIKSENPVVQAIISGTAPQPARLAAARGLLPLPQADLLEVLVALCHSDDPEIAEAATETLQDEPPEDLLIAAKADDTAPSVLAYLATLESRESELYEATILNARTPDEALAKLAASAKDAALLELIAINQQRLVRFPEIIEAILVNPARSVEAERRARETRQEFFEKERGAKQIAEELRARGKSAAAEFFETAELSTGELSFDDAWVIAHAANIQRIIEHERIETGDIAAEKVSLIRRIMLMNTRDRMKLATKGDREARSILIRDSNKIVSSGVMNNPRITEHEVENIAAMRTVADEVLRLIAFNRAWTRSYSVIHNLVRNPRTPIPSVINILPRIRTKDLLSLSLNRNVSENVRRQAARLSQARSGK